MRWMLYGATGYTGQLIAAEAVRRGLRPMLGGRNVELLLPLAKEWGLEYAAFRLDDVSVIAEAIADQDIVLHAAGPFIHTSDPMIRACLATNTHYLDITGDVDVFENTFGYDDAARKNGIVLLSGVAFDVVASDCLALHVAQQLPGADHLETGIVNPSSASVGTAKSALEMLPRSWWSRKGGELVPSYFGEHTTTLSVPGLGDYFAVSVPWGDVSVAYRSTGIPTITSYMAMPRLVAQIGRILYPVVKRLLKLDALRGIATLLVERGTAPPQNDERAELRSYLWARAYQEGGRSAEAWMETLEPYEFTAQVAVNAVEALAQRQLSGALTPAQAFGTQFVFALPHTRLLD